MNVVSLCTGVGGFDLGLERAGHRIVAQCEIDQRCRAILAKHWPRVPCFDDMRSVRLDRGRLTGTGSGLDAGGLAMAGGVDLLCGGTPCQDLSVAGRRAGLDGDRSGLFFEFARIADELVRPGGWLLFENVPGLLSSPGGARSGRDFAIVLATVADIGFHDLAWRVLDSRYFGVPQRRRRVYIVGRRASGDRARAVLLEPESGGGDFAPRGKARARVAASATRGSSSPGVSALGRRQEDDENIVSALDRKGGGADDNDAQAGHLIAHTLRAEGFDASEDGTGRGTPLVAPPLVARSCRGRPQSLSAGHNTDGHMVVAPAIVKRYGKETDSDATDTPVAGPPPNAHGVRAPTEFSRRLDEPKPDGPRYAQMGNAVTVNVAHWIGLRLAAEVERERLAA